MSERNQQDRIRRRIAVAGYGTAAAASVLTAGLVAGVTQTAQAEQQSKATTTATTTTTKAAATKTASATPTTSASTSAVVTAPQNTTVQGGSNGS